MTTYRLMDGLSGRPGNGPASVASYSGNFTCGILWKVTTGSLWFQGYWAWVPSNGDTTARKCALWQLTDTTHGISQVLVPGSTVTSGALTRGAWNFIALPAPIALSANVAYCAAQGWVASAGFPDTQSQFGSGQTYAAGITNGPLVAYSDQGASAPEPFTSNYNQMAFGVSTADPSVSMPVTGDVSSNFWIDVSVSDQAPPGATYKLWPSQPYAVNWNPDTANNFTLGTQFSVSQPSTLTKIWFYSPAGVTQLPTECAIFVDGTQAVLAGSDNASPAWKDPGGSAASAGDGWVYCDYSTAGVVLAKNTSYKVTVCNSAASPAVWSAQTASYWASPGPGQNGIANGPISAPNDATADSPGQSTYHLGAALHWPDTHAGPFNYWVDAEVFAVSLAESGTAADALTVAAAAALHETASASDALAVSIVATAKGTGIAAVTALNAGKAAVT